MRAVLLVGLCSLSVPSHGTGWVGTGRFSLEAQSAGGWTLLTPEGEPIFVVGLDHLASPFYYDVIQGANGLTPCRAYDTACAAADLFQTKYRRNWTAATEDFVARSKDWGFNSAGYEFVPAPGISWPYFPDLFVTNASHIFAHSAFGSASFPDVFADDFVAVTDRRVAEWCARDQHIDAARVPRDVVGYYFEDQPIWDVSSARMLSLALDVNTGNVSGPTDWADAMRTLSGSAPGKNAYVAWLKQRYGGDLSTVRPIYSLPSSVKTWVEVEMWDFHTINGLQSTVVADDNEFIGVVADQLFGVAAGAVRRHDPRALVFGQRFISHDAPTSVLQAAGRHFDVISVQPSIFSPESPDQVTTSIEALVNISKTSGRPVMVADQSSHYVEPGPPGTLQPSGCTPLQLKSTQCARNGTAAGALYAAFLSGLRSRSEIVGYAHCQYINRAVRPNLLQLKQGLLRFDGTPHQDYVVAVTRANHPRQ